jgi:hypothetical protein
VPPSKNAEKKQRQRTENNGNARSDGRCDVLH